MGIIQRQSIRSTIVIMAGFGLGAINMLILAPKVLTPAELGLTRVITDAGLTLATLCTFGALPIIYKFFPFYRDYLKPEKNDMPFLTLLICMSGFLLMFLVGFSARDIIVRKFSERSPLFVEYSYLVYPYSFFLLLFMWGESFSWSYKKGVASNAVRETLPRILFTALLLLLGLSLISLHSAFVVFSLSYVLPAVIIFIVVRKTGTFLFNPGVTPLTRRLGGKMINFGLFLFGAQFLNLLSRTADTFILTSKASRGLTDTAIFTLATYVVTLMEVPQRSMNSITIPVLADAWKDRAIDRIRIIYVKSVTNLLIIGLTMFCLIVLNVHNLSEYLGENFSGISQIVVLMGIGKLIDLGTGANSQILSTSSYWKVDFGTNVVYTLLALPLNYILISYFGLMGAAYSFVISLAFYNLLRFWFLWYQFGLQPYTLKDLLVIAVAAICGTVCYAVPKIPGIVIDAVIRSSLFLVLFVPSIFFLRISQDVNEVIMRYIPFGRRK